MTLLDGLKAKENEQLKRRVLNLKKELSQAGLLEFTQCAGCKSPAVVLTHVVTKQKEPVYQPITLETLEEDHPIALVCADCGRVAATLVRKREGFADGARVFGLRNIE